MRETKDCKLIFENYRNMTTRFDLDMAIRQLKKEFSDLSRKMDKDEQTGNQARYVLVRDILEALMKIQSEENDTNGSWISKDDREYINTSRF